jgi:hypothetical protein
MSIDLDIYNGNEYMSFHHSSVTAALISCPAEQMSTFFLRKSSAMEYLREYSAD